VRVIRLQVGPLAANAYLIGDEDSPACAVIDPGDEGRRIIDECRRQGLQPQFIIDTHNHADHVGANAELKAAFPEAELCIGARDADGLANPVVNLSVMLGMELRGPAAERLLEEGDQVCIGRLALDVLETPGHTPGGICLLAAGETPPQLFCGDLIFRGGVGRTDFPGGSGAQLLGSIRQKVLSLPDETVLWPGHGEQTTVGQERRTNPFLQSDELARL